MPRIAEPRAPAKPTSSEQRARHLRILRAAARIGARHGLDGVQMHDVAKAAGVAIATLYRYFPSKTHLFTAMLAEEVERAGERLPPAAPGASPEEAVAEALVGVGQHLLCQPELAAAMMRSMSAADAATVVDAGRVDAALRRIVLRRLGVVDPTATDLTLVRLLLQCWYGALQSSLNRRTSVTDLEGDILTACRLLLAARSNKAAADVRTR